MSLEKLLFTHKPLARRITALQRNLIKILSEGVGKIQKPLVFLHFSAFLIYSHSIVEVESVVFYANFGILFALKFFAVSIFYLFTNSGNATVMPRFHSNHQN